MTIIIENPQIPSKTLITLKNIKKKFDQGLHDHDVLVDLVHFPEGNKMQISLKLEQYCANQDQIRNQTPRLRRNTLFLGRKAKSFCKVVP